MDQVEHVARAFYDVQDEARLWEHESEGIKELFRQDARAAIALLSNSRLPGLAPADKEYMEFSDAA